MHVHILACMYIICACPCVLHAFICSVRMCMHAFMCVCMCMHIVHMCVLGLCDNGKSDISISAIIFYRFILINDIILILLLVKN